MIALAPDTEATYVASRAVIVGHCPDPGCGRPLAVFNDGGAWPLVACVCGWSGDTLAVVNRVRLDRKWLVSDDVGPERELRP